MCEEDEGDRPEQSHEQLDPPDCIIHLQTAEQLQHHCKHTLKHTFAPDLCLSNVFRIANTSDYMQNYNNCGADGDTWLQKGFLYQKSLL